MPPNLPPGVTESAIPGNRPEDVWYERFCEVLEVDPWVMETHDAEGAAALVTEYFRRIGSMCQRAYAMGVREGREDAQEG